MENYIDGFVLPIPKKHLDKYKSVADEVAKIWKEHGALAYCEYVGDDMVLDGTRAFPEMVKATEDEVIIFGWTVFESREARDKANKKVSMDPRMGDLIQPLLNKEDLIFNASRMVYGVFKPLVLS